MKTTNAERKGNDILKLVHRGGKVEIYTTPISAAEIMRQNPRHCVARPDVFKFPWIVVHPKSILKPGNVFYIVPNHTIHKLLQKQGYDLHNNALDLQRVKSSSTYGIKAIYESDSSVKKHRSGGHSLRSSKQSQVAAYDPSSHDRTNGKNNHHADESSVEYVHSNSILKKPHNKFPNKEDHTNEGQHLIASRSRPESHHRFITSAEKDADFRQSATKLFIDRFDTATRLVETDCSRDSEKMYNSVYHKPKSVTAIRVKPQAPTSSDAESEAKRDSQNAPTVKSCLKKHRTRNSSPPPSVTFTLPNGEIITRSVAQPRARNHPY